MNENTFIDSFFIRFNLGLIVFVCCLHFYILSHFETIRCIAKSLIATSRDFLLKYNRKEKNWKAFLGRQRLGTQTDIPVRGRNKFFLFD